MEELQSIYNSDPETDKITLANLQITDLGELLPLLSQFERLKILDLSNNGIDEFPRNLSSLATVESLNINGNLLKDTYLTIDCLSTLPSLLSLNINLNEEEQVDYIMKKLPELQYLNDLQVERDEEEEEEDEDDDNVLIHNEPEAVEQPEIKPIEEPAQSLEQPEIQQLPTEEVIPQQIHDEVPNIDQNDSFG